MVSNRLTAGVASAWAVVDALPTPASVIDGHGRMAHANAAWRDLHPPPHLADLRSCEAAARRDGRSRTPLEAGGSRFEATLTDLDNGALLVLLAAVTPGREDDDPNPAGGPAVGGFAAGIAHDFNNLLTVVQANLSEAEAGADQALRPLLRTAVSAARSAAQLAQQLMALGKATGAVRQPVPLGPQVDDLFDLLRRTIDPNVSLDAEVERDAVAIGSPSQIQQVLFNLALNAVDSMPDGGRLHIRAERADGLPPGLALREDGYVRIDCVDTGCGMNEATVARIFEPYFSTKGDAGTGLGLSMVAGIVRDHGGQIAVTTAPGTGTRMQIFLPAAPRDVAAHGSAVSAAPAAAASPGAADATRMALVIDDRAELRSICVAILRRAGYDVREAASGADALALVDAGIRPDVVLLDSTMPGLSGRETFLALRSRLPGVRVVFMTGYAASALDGLPQRDWVFLQKPFDSDTLLAATEEALAG